MPTISELVDLTDAAVTYLNGLSLTQAFVSTRTFEPRQDLEDLSTLTVEVQPGRDRREIATRNSTERTYSITVAMRKQVASDTELEAMLLFAEEVANAIEFKNLDGKSWVGIETDSPYVEEHQANLRQFTAVLSATYVDP